MSHSPWLTPDAVVELTGKRRYRAQCRELAKMGIPFTPNALGRPLVECVAVLKGRKSGRPGAWEPDWSTVKRGKAA